MNRSLLTLATLALAACGGEAPPGQPATTAAPTAVAPAAARQLTLTYFTMKG